jgi:hypothetical protein
MKVYGKEELGLSFPLGAWDLLTLDAPLDSVSVSIIEDGYRLAPPA